MAAKKADDNCSRSNEINLLQFFAFDQALITVIINLIMKSGKQNCS